MRKALLLLVAILFIFTGANAGEPVVAPIGEKGPIIRYYPNPISSVLILEVQQSYVNEFKSVEVKIVNLLGQEMIPAVSRDLSSLETEIRIDLSDIPTGVYFMEVYSTVNGSTVKQTRKITKT